ncbi:MAG: formylmethanofuran dehydrogenase subunit E family protein [bacterium]
MTTKQLILSRTLCLILVFGFVSMSITDPDHMHSKYPFRPLTMEELARFHGHLGPFIVLGTRIGEHAVTAHHFPRHFGLTVKVECPDQPPQSCLIDGLQLSTGATLGKRNISHVVADEIRVTLRENNSGHTLVYTFKDSTKALLKKWEEDKVDVEKRGETLYGMKAEDLFNIESSGEEDH